MKSQSFVCVAIVVWASSVVTSLNWRDAEFGGQIKWSFNCDFYDVDGADRYEDNHLVDDDDDDDNDDERLVEIIGQHQSSRQDCGWLCWADVRCHFYGHSQNVCRIMSLKAKQRPVSAHVVDRVTVPYLADSDTICGYIPSRIITADTTVN